MSRTALLLACLLGLPGCTAVAGIFVGANVATLIHADKTIPDIVLSEQRGTNCSLLHAARNEPYCQAAPPDPVETLAALANNRYCYRTLGRIDCYDRPDFMASGQTRVNFATGFLPAGRDTAPLAGIAAPAAKDETKSAAIASSALPPPAKAAMAEPEAEAEGAAGDTATTAPAKIDPRLTGTPLAQVPPLLTLPGQGTY